MFEYKSTENFDIGAGYGEYEYDFFAINSEDDFRELMNHYRAVYERFDYFLDGYRTVKNNTRLSPVVKAKMKEHNANLCLTLKEEKFKENNVSVKQMVVNEQKPDGIYKTYFFNFYRFALGLRAKDFLERGRAYAESGLHNAAIRYFSCAIELDPGLMFAFIYRGVSYLDRRNYGKAIEDFTQAINSNPEESRNPKESSVFSLRGLAYKESGDFEKAKADLSKALELNPGDEMAKECLEEINEAEAKD